MFIRRLFVTAICLIAAAKVAAAPTTVPSTNPSPSNVLIIGASSLTGLNDLLTAMTQSKGISMDFHQTGVRLNAINEILKARPHWDYVIMDAWHFGRGKTDSPGFEDAVTNFVKQVRTHSPDCKIILFAWWLPSPDATNADVMKVFHRCVEAARPNHIWVATTGPAFTQARLARPDLQIVRSKTDAHPAVHGTYLNACSLFAAITGQSPVGLAAKLAIPTKKPAEGTKVVSEIAPQDAAYLQELAWKVYERELRDVRPED